MVNKHPREGEERNFMNEVSEISSGNWEMNEKLNN
jgi:hypothetical protein